MSNLTHLLQLESGIPPTYTQMSDDYYYKLVRTPAAQEVAKAACEADGARLAIFKTEEQQTIADYFLRGNSLKANLAFVTASAV